MAGPEPESRPNSYSMFCFPGGTYLLSVWSSAVTSSRSGSNGCIPASYLGRVLSTTVKPRTGIGRSFHDNKGKSTAGSARKKLVELGDDADT